MMFVMVAILKIVIMIGIYEMVLMKQSFLFAAIDKNYHVA